jgi:hypothetical protein
VDREKPRGQVRRRGFFCLASPGALRKGVGCDAVVTSFVFEGGDLVQRVLALCLKLLQLFFPAADSIATVVERLVEGLAVERGLQFGNRFIERRYLRL